MPAADPSNKGRPIHGHPQRRDLGAIRARLMLLKKSGMGSEEGGEEMGRRTVVVGMRMDPESRELLTWALVKVVQQKDRVFALHVLPNASRFDRSNASDVSLMKAFDSELAVYEGLCSLKQIDLQLKICRASSLRKALVRETSGLGATRLVLGVAKSSHGIGSSPTSIAKYCAKKLSPECWVLAVNNGKIIFEKPPSASENSLALVCRSSYLLVESNSNSFCLLPSHKYRKSISGVERSWLSRPSSEKNCSARVIDCSQNEMSLALVPVPSNESRAVSVLVREEAKPGWPLLRRAIMQRKKAASEKSKIPVVQWAIQLPPRYQAPSFTDRPNQKISNEDSNSEGELSGESCSIVPTGTVSGNLDAVEKENMGILPKELESLHEKCAASCRLFNYQELASATSNFSSENLVGKGGSSLVYKGRLRDGMELAVKILKQSEEALTEFVQEIEIITTLHHKNIVSLLGFCYENNTLMLVYDFFSKGSLEDNLHGTKSNANALNWSERYTVAVGVAEALAYLHGDDCDQSVIHRDVKSSNILLSDDFEPQLSDFGLSTWISSSSPYVTCSDVAGTFGYLAPEYFMFGKVNEKIDVYAFGVILLELLTGRKPIDNENPKGKESLVKWAKPILQSEKPAQLLDPRIGVHYDGVQVERMILAASLCIRRTPRTRPKISVVLKILEGNETVTKWARLQAGLCDDPEGMDDATSLPASDFQSHLNLALLDVDDDALSVSSSEHCVEHILAQGSLEAYLQGRWSRSSSFD